MEWRWSGLAEAPTEPAVLRALAQNEDGYDKEELQRADQELRIERCRERRIQSSGPLPCRRVEIRRVVQGSQKEGRCRNFCPKRARAGSSGVWKAGWLRRTGRLGRHGTASQFLLMRSSRLGRMDVACESPQDSLYKRHFRRLLSDRDLQGHRGVECKTGVGGREWGAGLQDFRVMPWPSGQAAFPTGRTRTHDQ